MIAHTLISSSGGFSFSAHFPRSPPARVPAPRRKKRKEAEGLARSLLIPLQQQLPRRRGPCDAFQRGAFLPPRGAEKRSERKYIIRWAATPTFAPVKGAADEFYRKCNERYLGGHFFTVKLVSIGYFWAREIDLSPGPPTAPRKDFSKFSWLL